MRTEVLDLNEHEIEDMLRRNNYGHLACSLNDKPYVVPMNFAYEMPFIFVYTTAGMKSEILDMNPQICLQVEELVDRSDWRSVIVHGNATRIIDPKERERIFALRAAHPRALLELAAFIAAHLDAGCGSQPYERIAAETLAADHRFEQVRVREIRKLEINRQRGVEIREGLEHERDAVIARCRKLIEF